MHIVYKQFLKLKIKNNTMYLRGGMRMKILSVDMDFFSDILEGEEPESGYWEISLSRWQPTSSKFRQDEYNLVFNKLKTIPKLYLAIDHQKIIEIPIKNAIIYNIDYHPDDAITEVATGAKHTIHCGNWITYLYVSSMVTDYRWVCRPGSPLPWYDFTNHATLEEALENEYDIAFICLSPEWFPPNLQDFFEKIIELPHDWLLSAFS
jgi:hypothetical protein